MNRVNLLNGLHVLTYFLESHRRVSSRVDMRRCCNASELTSLRQHVCITAVPEASKCLTERPCPGCCHARLAAVRLDKAVGVIVMRSVEGQKPSHRCQEVLSAVLQPGIPDGRERERVACMWIFFFLHFSLCWCAEQRAFLGSCALIPFFVFAFFSFGPFLSSVACTPLVNLLVDFSFPVIIIFTIVTCTLDHSP